jgi:hypothetical protein
VVSQTAASRTKQKETNKTEKKKQKKEASVRG